MSDDALNTRGISSVRGVFSFCVELHGYVISDVYHENGFYFQLQRYCRCEYRDFQDLETLPTHVRNWKNFAFKAIIVAVRTSLLCIVFMN